MTHLPNPHPECRFSCSKARRELGYAPQRYEWQPVVDWFVARGHGRRRARSRHPRRWSIAVLLALLAAVAAYVLFARPSLQQHVL